LIWATLVEDGRFNSCPIIKTVFMLTRARKGIPVAPDAAGAISVAPSFSGDTPLDPEGLPFTVEKDFARHILERGQMRFQFDGGPSC